MIKLCYNLYIKLNGSNLCIIKILFILKIDEMYKIFEILVRRERLDIEYVYFVYCGNLYRLSFFEVWKWLENIVKSEKLIFYMI